MKKKIESKKSGKSWAIASVTGMILGATVATGAYFIYDSVSNKEKPLITYSASISSNVLGDIDVKMNEKNPDEKDKKYFLSEHALKMFALRIKKELNFGPEFLNLNSIQIDNQNMISDKEYGLYRPYYDTINLNTNGFLKHGLHVVSKDTIEPTDVETTKVELLMEILFHEYGHFQANEYIEGYSNDHGKVGTWNKDFEEGFENALGYDKKSAPLEKIIPGSDWQSMGALYSASDIYQKVNFEKDYSFKKMDSDEWVAVWHGKNDVFDLGAKNAVDKSNLKYLWSLEELYTRKYEQILYKPWSGGLLSLDDSINELGVWSFSDSKNSQVYDATTPYFGDTLMYAETINDKGEIALGGNYMSDNPREADTSKKMIALNNKHKGIGDDITMMFYDKQGKLHIGGFTNDNKFTLNIGGDDIKANVYPTDYYSKNNGINNMWVSEALDKNVVGKEIKVLDSTTNKLITPAKVRHGDEGTISTHRVLSRHSDYHLSYNTNSGKQIVTIEKGAGI